MLSNVLNNIIKIYKLVFSLKGAIIEKPGDKKTSCD